VPWEQVQMMLSQERLARVCLLEPLAALRALVPWQVLARVSQ